MDLLTDEYLAIGSSDLQDGKLTANYNSLLSRRVSDNLMEVWLDIFKQNAPKSNF